MNPALFGGSKPKDRILPDGTRLQAGKLYVSLTDKDKIPEIEAKIVTSPEFNSFRHELGVIDLSKLFLNAQSAEETVENDSAASASAKSRGPTKKCARCGTVKLINMFGKSDTSVDGHQSFCKLCRDGISTKRRKNDPKFRMRHHFATRISKQLGEFCPPNYTQNLEDLLGYSMHQLVKHLDQDLITREGKTFKQAMKEGYHVDHIRPLSSFPVIDGGRVDWDTFQDCWSLSNLRAIPADENLAKGATYDGPTCR